MYTIYISVIIPVYNAENYLKECLESVVNQTLKEIEIICINDGSTDNSLQILEEYAQKDERIKIINKEHEGPGITRKKGLKHATGKYISFIDSDDWIELDSYEKLFKNAISNDSDVVIFDTKRYNEDKDEYSYTEGLNIAKYFDDETIDFNNFTFNYNDIKPFLLNRSFSTWAKLYKNQFLRNYDDFYFPKYIYYEDVPFHVQVLLRASRISFCPYKLYVYRISNTGSISNASNRSRRVFDIFNVVNKVEEILNENEKMDDFKSEFFKFKISQLTHWMNMCTDDFKEEFFERVKENFKSMNLSFDDTKLDLIVKNKYQNILDSESYKEFELLNIINEHTKELQIKKQIYKNKINELQNKTDDLNNQIIYFQKNVVCLQNKQNQNISKIKSLEKDLDNLKKQMEIIANTKPYRLAYSIRRFSHEFLNGSITNKKDFLKWIYYKLTKKESELKYRYNPILALIKK